MLRKITQNIGRFKSGAVHDFPRGTWNKLAEDAGMALERFSLAVEPGIPLQSPLKGRVVVHKRLGTTH